jgi:hypothetical protein
MSAYGISRISGDVRSLAAFAGNAAVSSEGPEKVTPALDEPLLRHCKTALECPHSAEARTFSDAAGTSEIDPKHVSNGAA